MNEAPAKILVGWREWVGLPELGLHAIKAKVDTGAKTSALHAFDTERVSTNGSDRIRFTMHPLQRTQETAVHCECRLLDVRTVSDSGGHRESRFVIETPLLLGGQQWPIELTLTYRKKMLFRMLLGRRAMVDRILVDPAESYLTGKLRKAEANALYNR